MQANGNERINDQLIHAILQSNVDRVKNCLSQDTPADPNAKDDDGRSALFCAIASPKETK